MVMRDVILLLLTHGYFSNYPSQPRLLIPAQYIHRISADGTVTFLVLGLDMSNANKPAWDFSIHPAFMDYWFFLLFFWRHTHCHASQLIGCNVIRLIKRIQIILKASLTFLAFHKALWKKLNINNSTSNLFFLSYFHILCWQGNGKQKRKAGQDKSDAEYDSEVTVQKVKSNPGVLKLKNGVSIVLFLFFQWGGVGFNTHASGQGFVSIFRPIEKSYGGIYLTTMKDCTEVYCPMCEHRAAQLYTCDCLHISLGAV